MSIALIVVIVFGVVALLWGISVYNSLVTLRNRYKNSYAQIDVQLKRRYDLIPNLVECVKSAMANERETLEAVIKARGAALNANLAASRNPGDESAMNQMGAAEGVLVSSLSRLLAVAERYPELKSNQNMLGLQEELTSTENKIGFARQSYNDSVTRYNTKRELFPTVVVASCCGFGPASLFEIADPLEREAPKVKF